MSAEKQDPILNTMVADRYEVYAKLGEGGMGAVYAAKQSPLGRTVALKVLLKQLSKDPIAVKRFEKEALAISRLAHPNTVTIFDFGTTAQGLMYIAMEFLEGRTLRQVIEGEAPLAPRRVVRILAQIVRALSEAHQRGVIHRDLKPDNIMLVPTAGEPDFVKVLDFGVAKLRAPEGVDMKTLTQGDVIFGTPRYMSPEQVNGIMDDPRSDLYAVGAIAYEMLCGQPLFDGDSAMTILIAQVQQAPTPFAALPRPVEVPDALAALVFKLLSKDRNDRHPDAESLLNELDRLPVVGGGLSGPSGRTQGMLRPVLTPSSAPKAGTMQMGSDFVPPKKSAPATGEDTRTLAATPPGDVVGEGEADATPRPATTDSDDLAQLPRRRRLWPALLALAVLLPVAFWALGRGPVGSQAGEAETVTLSLSSVPAGAYLFVDGVPAGRAPLTYRSRRGKAVELRAELSGYAAQKRLLASRSDASVQFVLVALAPDAGAAAVDASAVGRPRPLPDGPHPIPRSHPKPRPKKDKDDATPHVVPTPKRDAPKSPPSEPGIKPLHLDLPKPHKPRSVDAGRPLRFKRFGDFKEIE